MSYEYDSKINRELAKTAMSIYINSQPGSAQKQEITESTAPEQNILSNHINGLLMEYVSDVAILAENTVGRELNQDELDAFVHYVVESIDGLGEEGRMRMISELAQRYGG